MKNMIISFCLVMTAFTAEVTDAPPLVGDPNATGGWTYDYSSRDRTAFNDLVSSTGAINYCGQKNQSPINVINRIGSYGWAYGLPIPKGHDAIEAVYKDLTKEKKVAWNDNAKQVDFHEVEQKENYLISNVGPKFYQTTTNKFKADSFKIRSPSEHMIMGRNLDIELQIKHNAVEFNSTYNMKYAYVSLLFSVEKYDKSITTQQNETVRDFFRHLEFGDDGEPVVDKIAFGQLMEMVNFNQRWTYKGSETFPPCEPGVYWNIITQILPIEVQTFAKFRKFMDSKQEELGGPGNNRMIQKIDDHNILYVGAIALAQGIFTISSLVYITA